SSEDLSGLSRYVQIFSDCRYAHILSYNDCLLIGYALNTKIPVYTTEKDLKKTIPNLKVKEYSF
ncbi:MAG: hypothetical protein ACOC4M_13180, partial [Promethearchaeia archaeon]